MFAFDAHLDLSMNAVLWNRDLTKSVAEIRDWENGWKDKVDRGRGTVSLPDMRAGSVGLCVATLIGRAVAPTSADSQPDLPVPNWHSPEIAWAVTQGQLAWYKAMEAHGQMVQIVDRTSLDRHLDLWLQNPPHDAPVGYILSLEGADSIWHPRRLELAYEQGLRAVGPVHYGVNTYGYGTGTDGGIGSAGRELLQEMERLNIILDATHLCDQSFWEALDAFHGPVWASHSNCRALVPDERQFADDQIKALLERGSVIGAALDAWMLIPGWVRGQSTPQATGVSLSHLVDHIDHVCQLAGNSEHAAIGTDLDGAFGTEQTAGDLDTIADLQKIPALLRERGYSGQDVENIMFRNWVRFLQSAWS